jgi:predicted DNA-binding helix-hairpin-helix protein
VVFYLNDFLISGIMDVLSKARILGDAGRFDSCGPKQCEVKVKDSLSGLYHAESENKNCVMLKTLMTNKCVFDCKYCPNSTTSKGGEKVSYSSDELVSVFDSVRKLGVNGLFLSSGISGVNDSVMEDMIDSVEKIRKNFSGYVHLKVMPGTSQEMIKRASEVANRLSVNIEAPSASFLSELSDCKDFKVDILRRQAWIRRLGKSQSTQMIVSRGVSDGDVLKMSDWEYNNMGLSRVYYSAFNPVRGTLLENVASESLMRQNSLYKSDFLLRKYGFKLKELLGVMDDGMLPREDPKVVLARQYFSGPLDVKEASRDDLLRVPGIGLVSASRILKEQRVINSFSDLKKLGVRNTAFSFIELNGQRQSSLSDFSK